MKIAVANSRLAKKWKNTDMSEEEFIEKLSKTTRTRETVAEYKTMTKAQKADTKDVGGFVGGELRDGTRRSGFVECRTLICLDIDYANATIISEIEASGHKCVVYSTHTHTPEAPRYRVIFFLKHEITEDEYEPVARMIANDYGMDLFDDSTYEASRLMYWPSTSADGEYIFEHFEGDEIDPEEILDKYDDWHDMASWPTSSRQNKKVKHSTAKLPDPTEKPGIVGLFCRCYGIAEVIEKYLSHVYAPCGPDRYDYIPASSYGGVLIYDNKYAYSCHDTDPASKRSLNAFDLVRIHLFEHLDEDSKPDTPVAKLPSYKAMKELALQDEAVITRQFDERAKEADAFEYVAQDEDDDWRLKLKIDNGRVLDVTGNYELIITNDPAFANVVYNEFKSCIDINGPLPWNQAKPGFNDSDFANARMYIEKNYGIYSTGKFRDALLGVTTNKRLYHPIKDYFAGLEWDGVPRLDSMMIDYLGAEDNDYTRAVTRKMVVAAVTRVYRPGSKFDTILVIDGKQGIGKSTIFAKLGKEWFSDSLSIADMKDKSSAEKLQGYLIMELAELAGLKKADLEVTKAFITRTDDKYRQAYGTVVESHPRSCIIVGTTNNSDGFLRDNTGNRRYWPVHCSGEGRMKPWEITDDVVDQIWAEAIVRYNEGEPLTLPDEILQMAYQHQKDAMEYDPRQGIVEKFLEMMLPEDWESRDLYERRAYINSAEHNGTVVRERVCGLEIWCECFDKPAENFRKTEAFEVISILEKIEGWERYSGNKNGKMKSRLYGVQRTYVRSND